MKSYGKRWDDPESAYPLSPDPSSGPCVATYEGVSKQSGRCIRLFKGTIDYISNINEFRWNLWEYMGIVFGFGLIVSKKYVFIGF